MENLRPRSPRDWPLVAGDVAEKAVDIEWALRTLSSRFATVAWVPGNHELWTLSTDPVRLRGEARYRYLVSMCRRLGVITPEDPWPDRPRTLRQILPAEPTPLRRERRSRSPAIHDR